VKVTVGTVAGTSTGGRSLVRRVAAWPWWLQAGLIYIVARVVSACIFMAAALHQGVNPWFPAKPDYWNFISIWDARWYAEAANNGYPSELPLNESGDVQENTWAFYALFPLLGRALSAVSGLGTLQSLTLIAMVSGLAAALVVYKLFREFTGHDEALWGVAFFSAFPVSAILQVPYAEPLNILLLASSLLLVVRRRYLAAMPFVLLMCLSRPTGVPFAAMTGFILLHRLWERFGRAPGGRDRESGAEQKAGSRNGGEADTGGLFSLGALVVVSAAGALAWPGIAWLVTGEADSYTRTETVWRGHDLVPFKPWFDTGVSLFGPVLGLVAPLVSAALFAWMLFAPPVKRLGVELRLWCACYMAYLLAFLHPQTSTFRMLLPLFPLALGAVFVSRSRAYRGVVLLMFVLLQVVWIVWLWAWAQLPGGGDYPP
jgi:hypothetical protein